MKTFQSRMDRHQVLKEKERAQYKCSLTNEFTIDSSTQKLLERNSTVKLQTANIMLKFHHLHKDTRSGNQSTIAATLAWWAI